MGNVGTYPATVNDGEVLTAVYVNAMTTDITSRYKVTKIAQGGSYPSSPKAGDIVIVDSDVIEVYDSTTSSWEVVGNISSAVATGSTNGLMSASDYNKLAGMSVASITSTGSGTSTVLTITDTSANTITITASEVV